MNEFLVFAGLVVTVALCAGAWCVIKELFRRWMDNDWCKHNWDMWGPVDAGVQTRFCRKCNKAEKSVP